MISSRGGIHLETLISEQLGQDYEVIGLVVNNQDTAPFSTSSRPLRRGLWLAGIGHKGNDPCLSGEKYLEGRASLVLGCCPAEGLASICAAPLSLFIRFQLSPSFRYTFPFLSV